MRFGLKARILDCRFDFERDTDVLVAELRRTRFCFGRCAGARRNSALRFEFLAKIAVKDFKAPISCSTDQLIVDLSGRRKLRKFVELLLEVKNLFL